MANYQVTARKWRPQDFNQVIGQDHVVTALTNAVNSGKIPHAYLFSGPRGVGKTSTARILAKLLNCVNSPNICGQCPACLEITSGQALDVREIDGASNRGIEQIREIRDNVIYTPLNLKYKIFIIDEVHMLTKEASNALLKVLEEPPAHVLFMLATTEPNKVLPTIRSRCQHYLLKRIPLDTVVGRLQSIVEAEGFSYEKPALEEIARAGDGSMRDSQTILDQVILYSEGNLTLEAARQVLGLPEDIYFEIIVKSLLDHDIITVLEQLDIYLTQAGDGMSFAENLTKFLRKALLVKKLPLNHSLIDLSDEKYHYISELFQEVSEQELLILINLSLDLCSMLRKEVSERFWIESTLFKMLDFRNRISLSELRQEIFKNTGRNASVPSVSLQSQPDPSSISAPIHENNVHSKEGGIFGAKLNQHQEVRKPVISTPTSDTSFISQDIPDLKNTDIPVKQQTIKQTQGEDIADVIQELFEI